MSFKRVLNRFSKGRPGKGRVLLLVLLVFSLIFFGFQGIKNVKAKILQPQTGDEKGNAGGLEQNSLKDQVRFIGESKLWNSVNGRRQLEANMKQLIEQAELKKRQESQGDKGTQDDSGKKREFVEVDKSYLDGALFIGDSRVETLAVYAGWDKSEFMTQQGLTIWTVMDAKAAKGKNGKQISIRQALSEKQYEKIYIMLGINELGRGTPESFQKQYKAVLKEIRELQPDAIIFVQSIMHVSQKKDEEGTYINNKEINRRNRKLKKLANGEDIFFIDENEVFDNPKTNKLAEKYTTDGVHLKPKYTEKWREFLLRYGIEK